MIASLLGLLVLAPQPVIAWLPPRTYKTKLLPGQPKGFRRELAVEGYRVLRDAPPDGSYLTPSPKAWEKALQAQGIFLIEKGEATQRDDGVNDAVLHLAATTAKADFYAYVTIDSEVEKDSDQHTRVDIFGTLTLDRALTNGGGFGFSIKNHVTVNGHDQPISAQALAEKFCVETRRQVPNALVYLANMMAAEKKQSAQNGKSLKDLVDGLIKDAKNFPKIP